MHEKLQSSMFCFTLHSLKNRAWGHEVDMLVFEVGCTLSEWRMREKGIPVKEGAKSNKRWCITKMFTAVQENWLMIGRVGYLQKGCVEPLLSWTIWFCWKERKGKQFICHFLSISCLISQSSPHGALTPPPDPTRQSLEKAVSLCVRVIRPES